MGIVISRQVYGIVSILCNISLTHLITDYRCKYRFVIAFEMETIAISNEGIVFHDEASHHIRFFRLGTTRVHSANLVAQSDTRYFIGVTGPYRIRLNVIDDQIVFFDRNGIYFLNKSSDCRAHEGSPKINTTGLAEYET